MNKTKVCIFCETWESGGIESFLNNILLRIDLHGLEVDIVAACLKESIFTDPLKARGICFYELSGSQRNLAGNYRRFQELLQRRCYDVIHVNAFQALTLRYLRLARKAGVPVRIAHSHNTDLRKSAMRQLKLALHCWASKRYREEATQRWACSAAAARFLFGNDAEYRFIPNGIDIERFRFDPAVREKVRSELGIGNDFVIGNIGRLCYQKNQSFLLDVFAQVVQQRPDSRLLLIGEGEDRTMLEEKARKLGIADKVIFYGVSQHVEQLLWAMDVFAFPSLFEGLGIVAIEAQAAGLPTICSNQVPKEVNVSCSLFTELDEMKWVSYLNEKSLTDFDRKTQNEEINIFDVLVVSRYVEENYKAFCHEQNCKKYNLDHCQ